MYILYFLFFDLPIWYLQMYPLALLCRSELWYVVLCCTELARYSHSNSAYVYVYIKNKLSGGGQSLSKQFFRYFALLIFPFLVYMM